MFVIASLVCIRWSFINKPQHDKTNKMACAPSEDSDQPGHPPSMIRVFAVRMKKPRVLSYPFSAQRRLIRLGGCPGWSESWLGTYVMLFVLSCCGSKFYWWFASSSAAASVLGPDEFSWYKANVLLSLKCTYKKLSWMYKALWLTTRHEK